ncbi:hypothetical protein [Sanguibacter antarcticus]|uniref:Uncharacterized protein n=1 Tax=Sanguibacter antarcticus TaxID=372484 RepID=A0A2A9E621_9MICO|nr:hypothetical protein [Sanguibacter antarcticus]PFG33620.1 hypothetical protein ATL42_1499 [Sanguibacter antarcticus]
MPGTSPTRSSTVEERQGLAPSLIAFIVLDVLLVVWAIWLGASLGSDEPEASEGATPSSSVSAPTTSAPATEGAAEPDVGAQTVASPSGNIVCALSPSEVRCSIATLASAPAEVAGCDGSEGYVVTLTTEGVAVPCISDADLPGTADATVDVLDYGQNLTVNNFSCDSTESGMKCTDTSTGKGFTLARAGISTY